MDQKIAVIQDSFHGLGVGDEIGGKISLVELHTFDNVESGFQSFGFFHGDGAVLTDLFHSFSDDVADGGIAVGGNGGDLSDLVADAHADGGKFFDHDFNSLFNTALQLHGIGTGGDVLQTFTVDGFGENGGSGGTVTGDIVGLAGDFLDHLGAHVGIGALEFDLLGDADTVFGDLGGAEFLVKDHVAALGPQSGFDSLGKEGHTFENAATGFIGKNKLFSHNINSP